MNDRRSFLSQLLSTAAAVVAATGALFAPRLAHATPPKVYPEYGVRRPDPKKKKPKPAVKYGIRRPSKKEDE